MPQVLAGKNGKAKDDQYKMNLGPGLDKKRSYKTKVKPFQPAEDSLDEPRTEEQFDETTQAPPQQVQKKLSGNSHREMHSAMDKMEEKDSHSNDRHKNRRSKQQHEIGAGSRRHKTPQTLKKLSMF